MTARRVPTEAAGAVPSCFEGVDDRCRMSVRGDWNRRRGSRTAAGLECDGSISGKSVVAGLRTQYLACGRQMAAIMLISRVHVRCLAIHKHRYQRLWRFAGA